MSKIDLIQIQNILSDIHILTIFSGRFSQGIIEELGEAVKKHLESEEVSRKNIFNVFSIFIEQTQNIKNYTTLKENSAYYDKIIDSGIVAIGKNDLGYFVYSGNIIENNDRDPLIEKLNLLKILNKDELKKLYKETLKKEITPDCKSAGIGLIDIARKSSLPIEYEIKNLDEKYSFYTLKVIV